MKGTKSCYPRRMKPRLGGVRATRTTCVGYSEFSKHWSIYFAAYYPASSRIRVSLNENCCRVGAGQYFYCKRL